MTGIMRVWCPTECDFLVHLLPENWNSELKKMQTQWCEQALHVHEVFRYTVSTPLTRFSRDCLMCLSHKLQARGNHHCHLTEKQSSNLEKPRAKCVEFRLCMSGWTLPSQLIDLLQCPRSKQGLLFIETRSRRLDSGGLLSMCFSTSILSSPASGNPTTQRRVSRATLWTMCTSCMSNILQKKRHVPYYGVASLPSLRSSHWTFDGWFSCRFLWTNVCHVTSATSSPPHFLRMKWTHFFLLALSAPAWAKWLTQVLLIFQETPKKKLNPNPISQTKKMVFLMQPTEDVSTSGVQYIKQLNSLQFGRLSGELLGPQLPESALTSTPDWAISVHKKIEVFSTLRCEKSQFQLSLKENWNLFLNS